MINVAIIEDEKPAMALLSRLLSSVADDVRIMAKLTSVKESVCFFQDSTAPVDLIFSDVQLPDGTSFDIFSTVGVKIPVIFTTCFDRFMLLAFEHNGIDYILKPIEEQDVEKALGKYRNLRNHFAGEAQQRSLTSLMRLAGHQQKTHLLAKKGLEHILLKTEDLVLFYTENKIVFGLDRFSKKYILDRTLSELETELDDRLFFRTNRQYIVNLDFVRGFKPYEKVKLLIELKIPEISHSIIVSQETAQSFRKWIRQA